MIIGVPRERKQGECRVALTTDGAAQLVAKGHRVLIEKGAGKLSGFTDHEYTEVGATVVNELERVWGEAELVVKVKEPAPEEFPLFRKGLAVFSFLHPAALPKMIEALVSSEVIGLDYDLVMLDDGRLPILEPMSIIAGKLAIQCGAFSLQSGNGGRGVLLGGSPGVRPGKVVVVGAGAAGSAAARVALGIGAKVSLLDINLDKLAPFAHNMTGVTTLYSSPQALRRELKYADIVVGSVLIPGALAPKLLTKEMLGLMQPGSVIVDICIDQGGFAETSRSTSIASPTYVEQEIVHYCVPNMPALVPRTSTIALTNATFRWIDAFVSKGIIPAVRSYAPLRRCLVTYNGEVTNKVVGDALGMKTLEDSEVDRLLGLAR